MSPQFRLSIISIGILGLVACIDGGGSSGTTPDDTGSIDTSSAFPAGLAVSSPTARTSTSPRVSASTAVADSEYKQATDKIAALLSDTTDAKDVFKADLMLQSGGNAHCYGPQMAFSGHPDGSGGTSPFPGGDLGIWTESENGEACASAELNQRLAGISSRNIMGLMGLAGMIQVVKANSLTLPTAGNTLTMTSNMTAAAIPDVTFSNATLSLSADGTTWSYNLAFAYNDGGTARNIVLALTHKPGASTSQYEGLFSYQVDVPSMGGNCSGAPSGATMNGTLYYNRASDADLLVNSREGSYCGSGITAATTSDVDVTGGTTFQLLDPSITYNSRPGDSATTTSNGWGDNFNMFAAQFNPDTLEGDYVYAWQAGSGDSHSRTFQLHMNAGAADGEAYFGFGDWAGSTDGSIDGMICNWAGPGNNHTPANYVQRQAITLNSGKFEASSSDITYAPTNSCTYDGTIAGFDYDRDLGLTGVLTGTDVVIVRTSGAGSGELNLDLMAKGSGTMQETIDAAGFALPPL